MWSLSPTILQIGTWAVYTKSGLRYTQDETVEDDLLTLCELRNSLAKPYALERMISKRIIIAGFRMTHFSSPLRKATAALEDTVLG